MNMNIINCTQHSVTVHGAAGPVTFEPSGIVPRLIEESEVIGTVNSLFTVTRKVMGAIDGLPEPMEGTIYIVSFLVAQAANREDVLAPGPAVRDEKGRVVGCIGFSAA